MAIEGWYYLHTNGELIYKRELGETAADIRESTFARGLWPMNPADRAGAWNICVEGLAGGANPQRVAELAEKWQCNDEDAPHYAQWLGVKLFRDGDHWCAARQDFVNVQESPCGFGPTCLQAFTMLARELGYTPSKMWGASLKDLVTRQLNSVAS